MKRELLVFVLIGALFWALTGVSVLAVALHEHTEHSDFHDHLQAFRTALHGHSHDGAAEHDHEPAAPRKSPRAPVVVQPLELPTYPCVDDLDCDLPILCEDSVDECSREDEPPTYLVLGTFLT